jgi:hypothetical protein
MDSLFGNPGTGDPWGWLTGLLGKLGIQPQSAAVPASALPPAAAATGFDARFGPLASAAGAGVSPLGNALQQSPSAVVPPTGPASLPSPGTPPSNALAGIMGR